jgi:hypothetical protein
MTSDWVSSCNETDRTGRRQHWWHPSVNQKNGAREREKRPRPSHVSTVFGISGVFANEGFQGKKLATFHSVDSYSTDETRPYRWESNILPVGRAAGNDRLAFTFINRFRLGPRRRLDGEIELDVATVSFCQQVSVIFLGQWS